MTKRMFHLLAGDMAGVMIDVLSARVNGLVVGTTLLASINNNQLQYSRQFGEAQKQFNFYPLLAHILVTNDSAVTGVATLSIGTNASTFDNILGPTLLTGLSLTNKQSVFLPAAGANIVLFGTDINVNVTGAGLGTALQLAVSLLGVFQPGAEV